MSEEWSCDACTFRQPADADQCAMCQNVNPFKIRTPINIDGIKNEYLSLSGPRKNNEYGKVIYRDPDLIDTTELNDIFDIYQINNDIATSSWPLFVFAERKFDKLAEYDSTISFRINALFLDDKIYDDFDAFKKIIDNDFNVLLKYIKNGHDIIVPAPNDTNLSGYNSDLFFKKIDNEQKQVVFHNILNQYQRDFHHIEYIQHKFDILQKIGAQNSENGINKQVEDNNSSDIIVFGYFRDYQTICNVASDIINVCVSYYTYLNDSKLLKLVYCDKNGNIDESKYKLRVFPNYYTFKQIAKKIENEWKISHIYDKYEAGVLDVPYIHLWFKFHQIKRIYAIDKMKAKVSHNEIDGDKNQDRWVEFPDDYLVRERVNIIDNKQIIVIEEKQNESELIDSWPIIKYKISNMNWPYGLQTGDIINVKDEQDKWYEALIRYVFPKGDFLNKMDGKCVVHYIGWNIKWDEPLLINDEDRIAPRFAHVKAPHRPRKKKKK
eukprot:437416_1